jgi:5-methyltetrahydrofolate--homocysteine methyltransferase
MLRDLVTLLADLHEKDALEITEKRLLSSEDPMDILADARKGMEVVGQRFASGEYFIPDLVYSGEILSQITTMVKPHISQRASRERLGKIVLGTVAGDIHDIGLNIVEFMLDVNGLKSITLVLISRQALLLTG